MAQLSLPRSPGPCIGTHQVSAVLRISEPYLQILQLCHLMQNTAVAAEITRTLQNIEWETCSRPN